MALRAFRSLSVSVGLGFFVAGITALGAGCAFSGSPGRDLPPDAAPPDAEVDSMPVTTTCPASYQIVAGTPLTSRYRKLDVAKTWDQQAALCTADGTHLVVFDSDAERRAIENFGANVRSFFWIGMTDRETEGEWKTVKGQVVPAAELAQLWGPGQPASGGAADNEDCMLIGSGNRTYYDYACGASFVGVCECD